MNQLFLGGAKGDVGKKKAGGKKDKSSENDAENEAPAAPVEEKEIDPLATAPKGTFDFDAFKRSFSNEDTETKAIPYLWDNFDAEHYSIYHAVYRYKEENTMLFMTSNLVSGMLQRIEKLRKHAFGIMYILDEEKKGGHNIEGLWIFRGQEVAFGLSENWNVDAPSYDFVKLDPNNQADKDKASAFILADTFGSYNFNPDKILDYQCFK